MYYQNIKTILLIIIAAIWLSACGSDVGGNEDRTAGVITLTSLNEGGEIIGTFTITWTNDEPNQSFVDIELSSDSGETYQLIAPPDPADEPEICVPDFQAIADATAAAGEDADALAAVDTSIEICAANTGRIPDLGAYVWDTNTVSDCRTCRIRITATDVAGNVSDPAKSEEDFIINNVPQVLGSALYIDKTSNGLGKGDEIIIPFDRNIELNASIASNVFFLPVTGDGIGPFSTIKLGAAENEVIITINDFNIGSLYHLHIAGLFDATKNTRTASSGLDILNNLIGDIIFAPDTGRIAEPVGDGIDITSTFSLSLLASDITAANTIAVALADLNDDTVLDAVTINRSNVQSIFSGDGDGSFTNIGLQVLGDGTASNNTSVVVGDIDGSNGPDIIVGGLGTNFVYTNNGAGTFSLVQSPGSSITYAVALADIDGKNGLDLITANEGANRVWRNNGSGVFFEDGTPQLLGTATTRAITLGDIDNDNDIDIIAGNNGANKIYINNGTGEFSDSGQILGTSNTTSVTLGDIDADGDLDIVAGNSNNQANRIYINDGTGKFTDSEQAIGKQTTDAVLLVDMDKDNDLDLIIGSSDERQPNQVWLNDGTGMFLNTNQPLGIFITTSIAVGDIDTDGDIDLLTAIFGTSDSVWLNSMRHQLQSIFQDAGQSLGTSDTRAIVSADVDGDGDQDVLTANAGGQANRVYLNDSKNSNGEAADIGSFTDSGQSLGDSDTFAIAVGDIDGVNGPDIITGNIFQDNRVWRNDGVGNFSEDSPAQLLGSDGTSALVLIDINNNKDLDLIEGVRFGPNKVWLNNGNGVFSDSGLELGTTEDTRALAVGDIDGINGIDIVAGNVGANIVYFNNGSGDFTVLTPLTFGGSSTRSVQLAHLDNDNNLDVVVANFGGASEVWLNNGGTLSLGDSLLSTDLAEIPTDIINTTSVVLLDLDKDGDLDIVLGNAIGEANAIWLNNGKGSFSQASSEVLGDSDTFGMTTADVDDDGDKDVITGNATNQPNLIWLNDF